MGKAARIESLTKHPDGSIEVQYTYGTHPLSQQWQGNSVVYPDHAAYLEAMAEAEAQFDERLTVALALSPRTKADPSLTEPERFRGRSVVIDLANSATPMNFS